jgi:type I restriction enzyme S subunit
MSELPEGWDRTTITDIAEVFLGKTPARHDYRSSGKLKVIKFRDLRDGRIDFQTSKDGFLRDNGNVIPGLRELRPHDVLITSAAHSGENIGKKCAYVESLPRCFDRIFFTGELLNIRCQDETLSRWVYFFFRSSDGFAEIQKTVSGVHLTAGRAKEMSMPLAPLSEQGRIVARLEKLLSRVDAAQARLANIPSILKRFRQAVLAAACSGRLTADWRDENSNVEPASQLVENINKHRQSRVVVELLQAREYPDDLPSTWIWVRFGSVIGELRNGVSIRPNIEPPGTAMLRINAARPGKVDLNEIRYLPNANEFFPSYSLQERDLLFTRYNGSLELLGICGMVRGLSGSVLLYPDKLMRVRFDHDLLLPEYTEIFFQAPAVHDRVTAKAKSSAGQNGVSGSDIKTQPLALAPLAEQQEIVRRVEALFKTADALKARYRRAKAHVDKLTQSILARAFHGELVPQDPNDEPASVLLERIKSKRMSHAKH